jgi:hypothetical protein
MSWKDLFGRAGMPQDCLARCDSTTACMLLGCRHTRPSNVTTNNLTSSEIELQARELLDRNVSRQVRRRIARKGL